MNRMLIFLVMSQVGNSWMTAGTGSAILPRWYSYGSGTTTDRTFLYVSNITGSSISVTITLYDKQGAVIQDGDDSGSTGSFKADSNGSVTNWDDNPSGASITFDLAGNASAWIYVNTTSAEKGYGLIEWYQDSKAVVACVAHAEGWFDRDGEQSTYSIPVHGGMPF